MRPGCDGVVLERVAHLERVDVRRFDRLLRRHPELDDVEEVLQEVLVLRIAALHGERHPRQAVLHRERRRQRHARALARLHDVERILRRVEHERLRALAEADAGAAGDHRRNPAAARRDRNHPAVRVRRLDRRRAGVERRRPSVAAAVPPPSGRMRTGLSGGGQASRTVANGFVPPWNGYGSPGLTAGVVALGVDRLRARLAYVLRQQAAHRLLGRKRRIAVVEIAIGEREVHRLVERVHVLRRCCSRAPSRRSSRGCSAPAAAPGPAATARSL